MRVTIDLMKKSTQIIDLSNVINPRVGDDDLQLPLHIGYGDNLFDMRGKDVEFLSNDPNKKNIYIAGTCNTNTPGDNLYMGDLTFRFPAGTFKADGTYDPDKTMFRIVDKETQKVISSVNVKITVMKNNIEFDFDPDKSSYDSRAETMLQDFHDKGQAMLDEIKDLNNQAKSNVSGDTATTAKEAKKQADQNAGDISDMQGEIAGARGRFADMAGREDAQDIAISQKESIADANANYISLKQKDSEQDKKIANKAEKDYITNYLSRLNFQPIGIKNEDALKQNYPNGSSLIFVTMDTGHWWFYDNGWTDAGLFQAAALADGSVNVDKLSNSLQSALQPTVQQINYTGSWSGFVSIYTGHNIENGDYTYSDGISVSAGDTYIINGKNCYDGRMVIFWNADEKVVGYFPQISDNQDRAFMFTVPEGATSMYINSPKDKKAKLYLVKDFNAVENVLSNKIKDLLRNKNLVYSPVTLQKMTTAGYYQYQTGELVVDGSTDIHAFELLDVLPFDTYRIKGSAYYEANLYNIYDYAGRVIESFPNTNEDAKDYDTLVTIPANGRYLGINQYNNGQAVSCKKVIEWHDKSSIADKKWIAIGDSWTAANTLGDGVNNYTNYVADRLGIKMVNAGIGGTGYVAQNGNYGDQFFTRQISSDGDAYTIFGSFNDVYVDGFKFGDIGDTDTKSLWGGMKATLDHVWSIKDDAIVGIIAPGPWGAFNPQNENNWDKLNMKASEVGEQYVATMKKFANYYSLPFLDLYHQSGLRPWDSNFVAKYYHGTSDTDTTHPNTNGHKIFASKIADFVNKLL